MCKACFSELSLSVEWWKAQVCVCVCVSCSKCNLVLWGFCHSFCQYACVRLLKVLISVCVYLHFSCHPCSISLTSCSCSLYVCVFPTLPKLSVKHRWRPDPNFEMHLCVIDMVLIGSLRLTSSSCEVKLVTIKNTHLKSKSSCKKSNYLSFSLLLIEQ